MAPKPGKWFIQSTAVSQYIFFSFYTFIYLFLSNSLIVFIEIMNIIQNLRGQKQIVLSKK